MKNDNNDKNSSEHGHWRAFSQIKNDNGDKDIIQQKRRLTLSPLNFI